jgi:hypothetical protein
MESRAFFDQEPEPTLKGPQSRRVVLERPLGQIFRAEILPEDISLKADSFPASGLHDGYVIDARSGDCESVMLQAADYVRATANPSSARFGFEPLGDDLANVGLWRFADSFGLGCQLGDVRRQ